MSGTYCTCGHGVWSHVAYTGGCGLCGCVAVQHPAGLFTITTGSDTREAS